MKTEITIAKEWKVIKTYDFLFTMQKGDTVEFENVEYRVDCCVLTIETDVMNILIH